MSFQCCNNYLSCGAALHSAQVMMDDFSMLPNDYMKQILSLQAFEAFNHSSMFDKAVFCLAEKQGMMINDERSPWYSRVGDFLMSVWDRRKEITNGDGLVGELNRNNSTPECNGTECYDGLNGSDILCYQIWCINCVNCAARVSYGQTKKWILPQRQGCVDTKYSVLLILSAIHTGFKC